jgi:hypothetical protein
MQSYSNRTGGTSKGIVNLHAAIEKADRLLKQKRTGSEYDRNEQLTLLSQRKPAFTRRNMLMAL